MPLPHETANPIDELVEKLRAEWERTPGYWMLINPNGIEAAAALSSLQERNRKLEAERAELAMLLHLLSGAGE